MLHAYSLDCGTQLEDHDTPILPASAQRQTHASLARLHDRHLNGSAAGHALLGNPVLRKHQTIFSLDTPRACMTATSIAALLDTPFC